MFAERLMELFRTGARCRIFTVFGESTGTVGFCDGEELHSIGQGGNTFRLYCIDILQLEEFSSVPLNK